MNAASAIEDVGNTFLGGGMMNVTPLRFGGSSGGVRISQVGYGESSLSLEALSYRIANRSRLFPGQNIAAFQVGDEVRVFESIPGKAHAEQVGLSSLTDAERDQVTGVFSELRPCTLPYPNCMGSLYVGLPNLSEISFSFTSGVAKKEWLSDFFRGWK
jgi:hypothetical protein